MDWAFEITQKNRTILNWYIENLSLEQFNKVPRGFKNNIIWNIAHTIATQQILVYRLSNLPMVLPEAFIEKFKKGTKTEGDLSQKEVDEVKSYLFSSVEKIRTDYNNGVFKTFSEYTVSTKSTLTNVEDAIAFNNFHEGIHLGYIFAQLKLV